MPELNQIHGSENNKTVSQHIHRYSPKADGCACGSQVFAENVVKMTYRTSLMKDTPSIQKSDINKSSD